MKVLDYLLMKNPDTNMIKESGQIPTRRIVLSLVGLILGIFFSFLITGINGIKSSPVQKSGSSISKSELIQSANETSSKVKISFPETKELVSIGLITFVICMITYQGLYSSLKLYENEPAFLVIFISFQYGFFWQSLVKGGAALLS
jgi:hypothetical protein